MKILGFVGIASIVYIINTICDTYIDQKYVPVHLYNIMTSVMYFLGLVVGSYIFND